MTRFTDSTLEMSVQAPRARDLREAREEFRELLARGDSREEEFQRLFSRCPFILSEGLPLHLRSADILPQGKPGCRGADFLIYPQPLSLVYGAIEIKRPDTTIVTVPRKNTLVLSRDSATALAQAKETVMDLRGRIEGSLPLCAIGGREYLFLIVGLLDELRMKAATERLRRQLGVLLPANCQLIPYDVLLTLFEQAIPPVVYVLKPETDWVPARSAEWHAAAKACVDYIRETRGPNRPDITHIQSAMRDSGYPHDVGFALDVLGQLVKDGVICETDSLNPPWETLYDVP
jgi:hypothetical protein